MINLSINAINCFNLSVNGQVISYSRLIDNRLYRVVKSVDCVLSTIKILSELSDDDFKFIATLAKSVEPMEGDNVE